MEIPEIPLAHDNLIRFNSLVNSVRKPLGKVRSSTDPLPERSGCGAQPHRDVSEQLRRRT